MTRIRKKQKVDDNKEDKGTEKKKGKTSYADYWRESAGATAGLRAIQAEEAEIRCEAAAYDSLAAKYNAMKAKVDYRVSAMRLNAAEEDWVASRWRAKIMKKGFKRTANVMNLSSFLSLVIWGQGRNWQFF